MTEEILALPRLRRTMPLRELTSFRIGGEADYFVSVENEQELIAALRAASELEIPVYVVAGGTNLVIADGLIKAFFIHIAYGAVVRRGEFLHADAGVPLASVLECAFSNSRAGLESLSGIPGTLGGAIVGNAGAYGRSIGESVEQVRVFDGRSVREFSQADCLFSYRTSLFKQSRELVVLSATLRTTEGEEGELRRRYEEIVAKRKKTYDPLLLCPGSFFKNVLVRDVSLETLSLIDQSKIIEGKIPVGYLLEQVGSKGMWEGGVQVAETHGNLLVNTGSASYRDVRTLAAVLKQKVLEKYNVAIEEEIRYIE